MTPEPREPYTFPCMDSSPLNFGYGYNGRDADEEEILEDENNLDEDSGDYFLEDE